MQYRKLYNAYKLPQAIKNGFLKHPEENTGYMGKKPILSGKDLIGHLSRRVQRFLLQTMIHRYEYGVLGDYALTLETDT